MANGSEMPDEPPDAASPASGETAPAHQTAHQSGQPEIDIVALAERVYRLMLAEIRLDRARGLASDQGG